MLIFSPTLNQDEKEEGDMEDWTASGDTLNFTLIEKSKELSMH